jgi:beta-aspartyl-dipeptidase (metallo-type)
VLQFATANTARILKLEHKGTIEKGKMGDLLVLERGSLDIVHVFANGKQMVRDGRLVEREKFLGQSDRSIRLEGTKES